MPHVKRRDIDAKFAVSVDGVIYKKSNGEAIPEDEPLFLLRARDRLAVSALLNYQAISMADGCNDYHFTLLGIDVEAFERFRVEYPERMKQPSVTRGA